MTLIYARRVDGWITMLGDTSSISPSGISNHPLTDPVIKVRSWHHDTLLGFAGNVHLFNRFTTGPAAQDFDSLVSDAVTFQKLHGTKAPDFLIAKRDGTSLVRIVDGLFSERPEAYIGSHAAYKRFRQRLDGPSAPQLAKPAGIAVNFTFPPQAAPGDIAAVCSAFHETLIDNVDNVRGLPIGLISCPGYTSYIPFVELWTGNDYSAPEYTDGHYAVRADDAWKGDTFLCVVPVGCYGVAYYSKSARMGFYWNTECLAHDPNDDTQGCAGAIERNVSAIDWFQMLADLHHAPVRAWCPSATGHFGLDDRTFVPEKSEAPFGPLAIGYREMSGET